jgi:hypothetical protein
MADISKKKPEPEQPGVALAFRSAKNKLRQTPVDDTVFLAAWDAHPLIRLFGEHRPLGSGQKALCFARWQEAGRPNDLDAFIEQWWGPNPAVA